MKVAVLSDLHLGQGDAAERFVHEDRVFARLLDELEGTHDRIFLLGDVWETLTHAMFPGSSLWALEATRRAHGLLTERFAGPKYVHFVGNHDPVASFAGAHHELMVHAGGMRYLFLHGDVFDDMITARPWLSALGVYAGGWLLRLGMHDLFRSFEQDSLDRLGSSLPTDDDSIFRQRARAWARAQGADVVVTGHTHKAVIADNHPTTAFLNSGSCLGEEVTWLSIDTARDVFTLHREQLTGARPRLRPQATLLPSAPTLRLQAA